MLGPPQPVGPRQRELGARRHAGLEHAAAHLGHALRLGLGEDVVGAGADHVGRLQAERLRVLHPAAAQLGIELEQRHAGALERRRQPLLGQRLRLEALGAALQALARVVQRLAQRRDQQAERHVEQHACGGRRVPRRRRDRRQQQRQRHGHRRARPEAAAPGGGDHRRRIGQHQRGLVAEHRRQQGAQHQHRRAGQGGAQPGAPAGHADAMAAPRRAHAGVRRGRHVRRRRHGPFERCIHRSPKPSESAGPSRFWPGTE